MFTGLPLSVMLPSLVMVTTGMACAVSFTIRTLGTSTSMPNSITWAVSMKIMSRTSTTSTKGVTLISERAAPPRLREPNPPPLIEIAMASLSEAAIGQVEELQREVVHARADLADGGAEEVVENGRGDGRKKAHRRGNQGFPDAGPHRPQAGAALLAQVLKLADNSHDRAQQADEWRHRSRGRQPVHVALQFSELFADAQLQGALDRCSVRHLSARLDLALDLFIAEIEDGHQGRGAKLLAGHHYGFEAVGLPKGSQEARIGPAPAAEGAPLREDHGPGINRETQQDGQHQHPHGAALLGHVPKIYLKEEGKRS